MTNTEQQQYEKALAKATIEGIMIAGKGTVKATRQQFYAVTSSDGTGCYSVLVAGHALVCTCKAGQAGKYCKHRAIVRFTITQAAAANAAAPTPAVCATCENAAHDGYDCADCHRPLCAADAAYGDGLCSACYAVSDVDDRAAEAEPMPLRRDTGPRLYRDVTVKPQVAERAAS
jgi:hypothetical protein